MSNFGGPVPWWRVVRADGSLPPSHGDDARAAYLDEGTPIRPSGRIDMPQAFWQPCEEQCRQGMFGWSGEPRCDASR